MVRKQDLDWLVVIFAFLALFAVLVALGCKRGAIGAQGIQGPSGPPLSVSVTTISDGSICTNGGTIVSIGNADTVICNGATGPAGVSSTPVTFIQFCPGVTNYPSTFSEIGLCINGSIYGVYSANNGFLSALPPGTYSSDGINSSCSFTILPDCQVTH